MAEDGEGDLWLFGYGSLIWKPPPHYDLRLPGYIEGYVRRFWQASEDHRGTPEAPGRVCTLIDRELWETLTDQHASAPPKVWGAAYRIPSQHVPEVKEYLDIREINGYSIQYTPFQIPKPQDMTGTYQPVHIPSSSQSSHAGKPINCLVYIGLPDNPQFLGPQDPQALAEHIVKSRGPSGENREYLYQLEEALNGLSEGSGDEHISDLARRCREVEAREQSAE
ncbi:related to E.coli cation transport protein [Ramularia collo-cygni]|uniref:glutathione-specific gamma-glutamylcyclotransferase n=1 Tax=Ramularia collo-cygni TaxID=112498 RepID=A0A2D3V421_9PEZI|nr:related to E.coli cation transport protein [Ramularia collo-cygni]CZT19427.1 related to E.coli cation transport protein [Ramularia collo-cygni]